jgi:hypothetical protein
MTRHRRAVRSELRQDRSKASTDSLMSPRIAVAARVWPGVRRAGPRRLSGDADAGPAAPRSGAALTTAVEDDKILPRNPPLTPMAKTSSARTARVLTPAGE